MSIAYWLPSSFGPAAATRKNRAITPWSTHRVTLSPRRWVPVVRTAVLLISVVLSAG
ncbi:hypothetical protein [Fodinicola feengrottensis]|uniref:hypothetical protein n=1 Tax=Fodinicola feengrottensis TaxID=435914 RepID=UPI002441B5E5|nr:hypothetical protein [Fodinicola feengrottensis]